MMQFFKNLQKFWLAKVLSLVGAIGIWFIVMSDENPVVTVSYTIPVQVQHLQEGLLAEGVPDTITVKVRGPRNSIIEIDQSTLKAFVDLEQAKVGQEVVPIKFTPPSGAFVESMTPSEARVSIDAYVTREFNVEPQNIGKMPDDIAIKKVTILPTHAVVGGAKHLVDQVAYTVIRVNMADRRNNFAVTGDILPIDAKGMIVEGVTVTPRQGQAQYEIEKIRGERRIPVVANLRGEVDPNYVVKSVSVEPRDVVVFGIEGVLRKTEEVRTTDILLDDAKQTFTADYDLVFPEGLRSTNMKATVRVEIVPR